MVRSAMRFDPPWVEMTAEVRWLLTRGFGTVEASGPTELDGAEALRLARLFGIGGRIAARHDQAHLGREVGAESARELRELRLRAVASAWQCEVAMDRVAVVASEAGIELVFLKFAALRSTVELVAGCRLVGDLDVLVAEESCEELYARLLEQGWESSGFPPTEQHLSVVRHAHCGPVEIHRVILGVQVDGAGGSATLGDLRKAGLIAALGQRPGCWIPTPACLVAHLLVHGVVQHGYSPQAYRPLQMFVDLIDLGFAGRDGEGLVREAMPLVSRALGVDEVTAVLELCRTLADEGSSAIDEAFLETPAGVLLRHSLAGRLSKDYRAALKLKQVRPAISDRSGTAAVGGAVLGAVVLTRAQIDKIYGRPRTEFGYLVRRVLRLFDLVWRFLKYSVSLARGKARRRVPTGGGRN